jgi:hypothetical protein
MKVRESIIAVLGALAAAFVAQLILVAILAGFRTGLGQSTWLAEHMDVVTTVAYAIGFLVPAVAAGITLGRLLPSNPIAHVVGVGVASPLLTYALVGPSALATGWQVAGYAAQLCVIGMLAIRVHDRRQQRRAVRRA